MKELAKQFTKKGVTYTQIEKNNKYVIYECIHSSKEFSYTYYEVFKYKVQPYPTTFENPNGYKLMESYPSNESFGQWAWCCSNWRIVEKVINKHNLNTSN